MKLKIRQGLALVPSDKPMLSCAIYARKSTADDRDKNPENKSTAHQIAKARAYAASKGWRVNDEYVFSDDGISGAEYVARPGLAKLIAALPKRGKPPFDVLLMTESSRLGRDMTRNAAFVVSIIESGVRIFYCLTDEEEKADTPEQKFMLTARSYASEVERIKAGQRARAVLESKAKQGYCAGGSCYGYNTVEKMAENSAGEKVRSHVDYEINEQEASVVRHIFGMYLAGHGHASIAKALNGDPRYRAETRKFFDGRKHPGPRNGTGSWAPSSIRAMLYNERYTGKVPYGRLRRIYRGGTQTRIVAGKPTYAERPDLRIIGPDLWDAVQKRLKAVRRYYVRENGGTLWGRPEIGRESRYLLSGIARCGLCGSSLVATKWGNSRQMYSRYACSYNSNRGRTVCTNNLRESQDKLDAKVLREIERRVLNPEAAAYVVDQALKRAREERKREPDKTKELEARIKRLEREKDNLLAVAKAGKVAPESILTSIRNQEAEIEAAKEELARSPHRLEYEARDLERFKEAMAERIAKFRELMHADVPLARQALRKLLNGPIKCTPVTRGDGSRGYEIAGETKLGALFVPTSVRLVPRKGFEPPQCCHR